MAIPIINVSILNGSNGFRLNGVPGLGASVSSAGDINGDGFDDVMVGALYTEVTGNYTTSSSYVVFGQASGFSAATNLASLDGNNGFRLDDENYGSYPFLVSDAGDVNGDGFDDVIIGDKGFYDTDDYGNPIEGTGTGYVIFGRASGFAADINLPSLDGNDGFRLGEIDGAGISISGAGDVNGDGFADLIVGSFRADPNGKDSGSSYVVFGKAAGFGATMDLSSLDGSNGFRLDGVAAGDFSGIISNAGDVNGDGFDDLIVGASGADPNGENSGSSYVVFGKAAGFGATMDLSSLDGTSGFRLDGVAERDASGASVSNAGDVNGDGFGDVIVGAYFADPNGRYSGSSYVVFGKANGFEAATDLSSLDGSNGFRWDGAAEGDRSGRSVSSAGDVNGDGFGDVIIGARGDSPYGASYVLFGKTSGFDAVLNLSSLDGNSGFRLEGDLGSGGVFGSSVSSAGDVNSDGFDDLIVGANGFDRYGASYVVFGGSFITGEPIYLGTPGDDNLIGTEIAERFDAGDGNDRMNGLGGADVFHGDAGDDTIMVADLNFQQVDGGAGNDTLELTGDDLNLNLAELHDSIDGIETIDLSSFDGEKDNTLTLTLPGLLSLSDTTDTFTVDGDVGDRVIGLADGWTDGGIDGFYHIYTNQGTTLRVGVVVQTKPAFGVISLDDLDGSNGFRLDGVGSADYSGLSVSSAGDINGDGFDDVIIGALRAGPNGGHSGSSYVVFGRAAGFEVAMDLSSLDGSNGFRLDGATDNQSGGSVSSAGDVNGDGIDDVIVGAPGANNGSGSSYVVFGKANDFGAVMDLSSLDGSNGFRLDGERNYNVSGGSVSSAGDVNGDGIDDVIIGALGSSPNGVYSGSSYVVFGKADGFGAAMNLSSLDGSNGFRLDGVATYDASGSMVSSAGDVNGDGFDDVIIGAARADPNDENLGSSYVVFGRASGFSATMNLSGLDGSNGFRLDGIGAGFFSIPVSDAGDINGDGFGDVIIGAVNASYVVFGRPAGFSAAMNLSSLDGSNGFRLDGETNYGNGSVKSVSSAGDVNGDGFDDVLVGTPYADPNGNNAGDSGSSYVVFGKASGFSVAMNLSSLDGNNGFRLDGAAGFEHSGTSVSGAGDVNGDGFDDLIVGAPNANANGSDSGSSYVIFGRSDFGGGNVIAGTSGNDVLKGTLAAEIFEAGDGNDLMIGRGGADVFHGGAGDDDIRITDLGFTSIDGGTGDDRLHLDGSGLNLNLADFEDKISGIETICIYGRGDNTLTLTAADLRNLSDTTNTLKVNGNAGDRIVLEGDWVDGGSRGFYHTYTQDDVVLLVGMNLAMDFA